MSCDGPAGQAGLLVLHFPARHEPCAPHSRLPGKTLKMPASKRPNFLFQTYSSDARYSLDFAHPNNYRLRVSRVELRDRGYYHCQLATHPPQVNGIHQLLREQQQHNDFGDKQYTHPGIRQSKKTALDCCFLLVMAARQTCSPASGHALHRPLHGVIHSF